jgi:hypothetical protein
MQVNLVTSADKEFEGICPDCHEHTTAGDSCCGRGAIVEGGLVTDEEALADIDDPFVCVRLLIDAPQDRATALKTALFAAGISSMLFSGSTENAWCVNVFVPVASLAQKPATLLVSDLGLVGNGGAR